MIRKDWQKGIIQTFIGCEQPGYSGDGGIAKDARINGPAGLAIDSYNNVYVAEVFNHIVRKIDVNTNHVTTIAGCGEHGFSGDGGIAVKA